MSRWQMSVMGFMVTTTQTQKTAPIKINLDRMKSALSAESFVMPQGLSREEKRRFILEAGKK
ncbi:hypothetical protein KTH52_17445 [Acinetobacter baumannii]|nr:hypothetical protein [Acinetobacter baumannii]